MADTEEKSKVYNYAIISQQVVTRQKYYWEKRGKYVKLLDAEKAIKDYTNDRVTNAIYRIVPYFEGHFFADMETDHQTFREANSLLWSFLKSKKLDDEAREFMYANMKPKRHTFF